MFNLFKTKKEDEYDIAINKFNKVVYLVHYINYRKGILSIGLKDNPLIELDWYFDLSEFKILKSGTQEHKENLKLINL